MNEGYAGALEERRAEAAQLAGAANEVGTLGTFGAYHQLGELEYLRGDLFLVVRDARLTEDGRFVLGRDYYIAATELFVPVNWYGEAPQLALVNSARGSSDQCCNPQRVCVPLRETRDIYKFGDPRDLPESFQVDTAGEPFWEERAAANLPPVNLAVYSDGSISDAHRPFEYSCRAPAQPRCVSFEPHCNGLPVDDPEAWLTDKAQVSVGLPASYVYVIPESAFREAKRAGTIAEASDARKPEAVALAGAANDPSTLGVLGHYVDGFRELRGDLFIVARSHRVNDSTQLLEVEDYYVVAAELAVQTPWHGEASEFLLSALPVAPRSDCCNPARRCVALGDTALDYSEVDARALPNEVEVELQGTAFHAERRGRGLYAIDLEVYGGRLVADPERAFEYSCKVPVQPLCEVTAPGCAGLPILDPEPPSSGCVTDGGTYASSMPAIRCEEESIEAAALASIPFPRTALVIREADFLNALDGGAWQVASHDARLAAAQIGGMGNDTRTLGIIADLQHEGAGAGVMPFSGELFVVAKSAFSDPQRSRIETASYYVAAVNMSGTASWLGTSPTHGTTRKFDSPSTDCCGEGTVCVPLDDAPGTGCETLMSPQVNLTTSPGAGHSGDVVTELFDREKCAGDLGGFSASLCSSAVIPACTISRPQCVDSFGGVWGDMNGGVSVPGGGSCGHDPSTPVNPREVPKVCTQVSGGAMASSAGRTVAECGGYCEYCGENYWERERNGLPPGCAAYRPDPDSDICTPRTNSDAKMEAFLRLKRIEQVNCHSAGQAVEGGGTCCGKNCVCTPTGANTSGGSVSMCTECNGLGECRVFSQRSARYDPLVAGTESDPAGAPSSYEWDCSTNPSGCTANVDDVSLVCHEGTPADCMKEAKCLAATSQPCSSGGGTPYIAENRWDAFVDVAPAGPTDDATAPTNTKPDPDVIRRASPKGVADPILIGDGSLDVRLTDLSFKGPARALTFERHYNSRSDGRSVLGSNWVHNWQVFIDEMRPDTAPAWAHPYCKGGGQGATCLLLHDGVSGRQLFVHDIGRDLFVPIAGGTDTVTRTAHGGWVLRTPAGNLRTFGPQGYLVDDRDRFGNGFRVLYEPTPLETLHARYCRGVPESFDEVSPNKAHCQAVGSLLGISGTPYPDYPPTLPDDVFPLPTDEDTQVLAEGGSISPELKEKLAYARKLYAYLLGRGIDGAVSYGPLRFRPIAVEDDLQRTLEFVYASAPLAGLGGGGVYLDFSHPRTELLQSVEGPGGAKLEFSYGVPTGHPRQLHEAFLTTVLRSDATALPVGISPAPYRWSEYKYLWPDTTSVNFSYVLADTGRRYWEVFRRYLGCVYSLPLGEDCSDSKVFATFTSGGYPVALAHKASRQHVSDIADNIIELKNSGIVEAETQFDFDPMSSNFDAAIAQRHGSIAHVSQRPNNEPVTSAPWANPSLPLTTLAYVEAGPSGDPSVGSVSDRTEAFLPPELASRFPLESPPSGGLWPVHQPTTIGKANGFAIFEGTERCMQQTWAADGNTEPCLGACNGDEALDKVRELPGFSFGYHYFSVPNEGHETALKRSRLGCDLLGVAQLFDPAHNDNISELVKAGGADDKSYVAKLLVGGRSRIQADANRICRWAKVVDRDGATQYFGLNFKGQALVEAAYDSTRGKYLVTERLYNADGMPLAVRQPSHDSQAWTPSHGSTRFPYEEYDPEGNQGWNAAYPMYWAKRKNLLVAETYASTVEGGADVDLRDFPEDGRTIANLRTGEYVAYRYEPLFNQLIIQEEGIVGSDAVGNGSPDYRVMAQTQHTVDYQELNFDELTPLLSSLRPFGVDWVERSDGSLDKEGILAFQLPMELGLGDVNGDGRRGLPFGREGAAEGRGLPLYSGRFHFDGQPSIAVAPAHTVHYGWAPHGLPSAIIEDGRSRTTFSYYSTSGANGSSPFGGDAVPAASEVSAGYRGFLAEVVRETHPREYLASDGPPVAPCQSLQGPYQWMLGDSCGANPRAELEALGIAAEVAEDIVAAGDSSHARARTTFSYSLIGTPRKVWLPRGAEAFVHDTDGRLVQRKDAIGNTHAWIHDNWGRQVSHTVTFDGTTLHAELYGYDEEGRLVLSCVEQAPGACLSAVTFGSDEALLRSFRYSGEGLMVEESDNAGLAVSYQYDSLKRLVWKREDDVSGQHSPSRFTAYDYTPQGLLKSRTGYGSAGEALSEFYYYDGLRRLWRHVDSRQAFWHFAYSRRNLPVGSREGATDYPAARSGAWEVRQQFDRNRRLVRRVVNDVNEERFTYTSFGQVASRKATGYGAEYFTYDADGNLVWRRAPGISSGGVAISGDMSAAVALPERDRRGFVSVEYATSGASLQPPHLVRSAVETLRVDGAVLRSESLGGLPGAPSELTSFDRSQLGHLTSVTRPDGTTDLYTHNLLGWVTELSQAVPSSSPEESVFRYSPRGQALSVVDPANVATSQVFDGFGALRRRDYTNRASEEFHYDGLGRIRSSANGTHEKTTYEYFPNGREVRELGNNNTVIAQRYFDSLGRLTSSTYWNPSLVDTQRVDRAVLRELEYDGVGRLSRERLKVGQRPFREVESTYSLSTSGTWQRVLTHPAVGGGTRNTTFEFDEAGRLSAQVLGQVRTAHEYVGDTYSGRVQEQYVLSSPLRLERGLDAHGRPVSWSYSALAVGGGDSTPVFSIGAQRDSAGRVARVESQWGAPLLQNGVPVLDGRTGAGQEFQYDSRARLASVREYSFSPVAPSTLGGASPQPPVDETLWKYVREQVVGSTLKVQDESTQAVRWSAGLVSGSPRGGHQLKGFSVPGGPPVSVSYDAEGSVAQLGDRGLEFDARGQLARVHGEDNSLEQYFYDDSGRLVARQDESGSLERFLYDGAEMIAADDGSSTVRWEATWGPGIDQLIELRDARGPHAVLTDHRSSVVGLWHNSGVSSRVAEYTPEGRVTTKSALGTVDCTEQASGSMCGVDPAFPFGFSSAWRSSKTGLVYMRARWYSAELGEFVSQDPMLYVDSFNPYAYVGFDPINHFDPGGAASLDVHGAANAAKQAATSSYLAASHFLKQSSVVKQGVDVARQVAMSPVGRSAVVGSAAYVLAIVSPAIAISAGVSVAVIVVGVGAYYLYEQYSDEKAKHLPGAGGSPILAPSASERTAPVQEEQQPSAAIGDPRGNQVPGMSAAQEPPKTPSHPPGLSRKEFGELLKWPTPLNPNGGPAPSPDVLREKGITPDLLRQWRNFYTDVNQKWPDQNPSAGSRITYLEDLMNRLGENTKQAAPQSCKSASCSGFSGR